MTPAMVDVDEREPIAGPSRLPSTSPPLSPPPSPPATRRKRRLSSASDDDEYKPQPTAPLTTFRGGGKTRTRASNNPSRLPDNPSGRKRLTRARARRNSSPSIATDLESIATEDAAVKQEVTRLNLGLRDVQGDGNCLFRALADQLWGSQKRHVEVRKLVCDYLETNKESMEAFVRPFLYDRETYENYVDRMRQLSECKRWFTTQSNMANGQNNLEVTSRSKQRRGCSRGIYG